MDQYKFLSLNKNEIEYFNALYRIASQTGPVQGINAVKFLQNSKLSNQVLKQIWALAGFRKQPFLAKDEFFLVCKYISLSQNGFPLSVESLKQNLSQTTLPYFEGFEHEKYFSSSKKSLPKLVDDFGTFNEAPKVSQEKSTRYNKYPQVSNKPPQNQNRTKTQNQTQLSNNLNTLITSPVKEKKELQNPYFPKKTHEINSGIIHPIPSTMNQTLSSHSIQKPAPKQTTEKKMNSLVEEDEDFSDFQDAPAESSKQVPLVQQTVQQKLITNTLNQDLLIMNNSGPREQKALNNKTNKEKVVEIVEIVEEEKKEIRETEAERKKRMDLAFFDENLTEMIISTKTINQRKEKSKPHDSESSLTPKDEQKPIAPIKKWDEISVISQDNSIISTKASNTVNTLSFDEPESITTKSRFDLIDDAFADIPIQEEVLIQIDENQNTNSTDIVQVDLQNVNGEKDLAQDIEDDDFGEFKGSVVEQTQPDKNDTQFQEIQKEKKEEITKVEELGKVDQGAKQESKNLFEMNTSKPEGKEKSVSGNWASSWEEVLDSDKKEKEEEKHGGENLYKNQDDSYKDPSPIIETEIEAATPVKIYKMENDSQEEEDDDGFEEFMDADTSNKTTPQNKLIFQYENKQIHKHTSSTFKTPTQTLNLEEESPEHKKQIEDIEGIDTESNENQCNNNDNDSDPSVAHSKIEKEEEREVSFELSQKEHSKYESEIEETHSEVKGSEEEKEEESKEDVNEEEGDEDVKGKEREEEKEKEKEVNEDTLLSDFMEEFHVSKDKIRGKTLNKPEEPNIKREQHVSKDRSQIDKSEQGRIEEEKQYNNNFLQCECNYVAKILDRTQIESLANNLNAMIELQNELFHKQDFIHYNIIQDHIKYLKMIDTFTKKKQEATEQDDFEMAIKYRDMLKETRNYLKPLDLIQQLLNPQPIFKLSDFYQLILDSKQYTLAKHLEDSYLEQYKKANSMDKLKELAELKYKFILESIIVLKIEEIGVLRAKSNIEDVLEKIKQEIEKAKAILTSILNNEKVEVEYLIEGLKQEEKFHTFILGLRQIFKLLHKFHLIIKMLDKADLGSENVHDTEHNTFSLDVEALLSLIQSLLQDQTALDSLIREYFSYPEEPDDEEEGFSSEQAFAQTPLKGKIKFYLLDVCGIERNTRIKEGMCSLCMGYIDHSVSVHYKGRYFHNTCINYWLNRVQTNFKF